MGGVVLRKNVELDGERGLENGKGRVWGVVRYSCHYVFKELSWVMRKLD